MDDMKITVSAAIQAPISLIWKKWTTPGDVMAWNNALPDWHTPSAINDLRVGGEFHYLMAAKDGSASFDFFGVYDEVIPEKRIAYTLGDGRKAEVEFSDLYGSVRVTETFDAEHENPREMQKAGWQAILDNFKRYVQSGGTNAGPPSR